MTVKADFHVHSRHSGDSTAPMEKQVLAACEKGLQVLCFTEHFDKDWPYHNTPDLPPGYFDLDLAAYRREFLALQDKYQDRIELRIGIELGLQPHLGPALCAYLKENDFFDFVIGSTHVSHGMDPYYSIFFEGVSEKEAWRRYFEDALSSISAFHDVDTYGHLDYVVRYGPTKDSRYDWTDFSDVIEAILEVLVQNGVCLELNTANLVKGCRAPSPAPGILRRYREMGGIGVTIGSDAHAPAYIGAFFDQAARILAEAGYDSYTVFKNRKAEHLPL